jgi:hypothetical protein
MGPEYGVFLGEGLPNHEKIFIYDEIRSLR